VFRERVDVATWAAIAVVILGVAIMVSESLTGQVSPIGDSLSLLVALAFAGATVITRRHAQVGMMPAVCTGTIMAALAAGSLMGSAVVSPGNAALLFVFGALNLAFGHGPVRARRAPGARRAGRADWRGRAGTRPPVGLAGAR